MKRLMCRLRIRVRVKMIKIEITKRSSRHNQVTEILRFPLTAKDQEVVQAISKIIRVFIFGRRDGTAYVSSLECL
jgi:hypothetical protein